MIRFRGRVADLGYAAGWRLTGAAPQRLADAVFRWGADLATEQGGEGVTQLRRNLARVVPQADEAELDDLVRDGMRSYARYWCEMFRLPVMDLAAVHRAVDETITGVENLDAALAEGNGAVLALPHSGNWDVAGVWLVHHAGTFTTVAARLQPESLFRRFVAFREALGFEVLPINGGRRPPSVVLAERLRQNRVVCLLGDRELTAAGVPVTFFGEETRMPAGPAYLAARTGAALLPVGSWFTATGWGFRVHPPIRVAGPDGVSAATQALADVFAADIASRPADWHMLQKLWVADLPPRRRAALARASAAQRPTGRGEP
ncbi:phosphatidylinositol mannoside acyltransferase [Gandjariella thermophila]|uniref:Lipid A biosynthesis lauroyl acyltransferase n=1 Tax=Gandjariella thermophila TaxID=1931992 RepID=A0A4D4J0X0_9PSEU|nr:phosphatidylinositol mannoside acyltransferase [Gandjariella thermophila]GDY28790.1 lipid A biosynthesis lauroyl acyltransferase [Gandjariella thermophila]